MYIGYTLLCAVCSALIELVIKSINIRYWLIMLLTMSTKISQEFPKQTF